MRAHLVAIAVAAALATAAAPAAAQTIHSCGGIAPDVVACEATWDDLDGTSARYAVTASAPAFAGRTTVRLLDSQGQRFSGTSGGLNTGWTTLVDVTPGGQFRLVTAAVPGHDVPNEVEDGPAGAWRFCAWRVADDFAFAKPFGNLRPLGVDPNAPLNTPDGCRA